MGEQAKVHSIDALKDFRAALAVYGEDTLAALTAIESEVRRTTLWLEQNRPGFWQDQIKRRREEVSIARGEVFRRNLQKRPGHSPAMSEQKENLRKAEASLQDAEKRLVLVRKWRPKLQHAVLEYHAAVQRLGDLAAADVPSACGLLGRLIDSLEAYARLQAPSADASDTGPRSGPARATDAMESIAIQAIGQAPPLAETLEKAPPSSAEPPEAGHEIPELKDRDARSDDAGEAEPPEAGGGEARA